MPLASSIIYLTGPHFGIGAGIGAVDASLVPLLATLVMQMLYSFIFNQKISPSRLADNHRSSENIDDLSAPPSYGRTFALGQTAVSLAYCLGELILIVKSSNFRFITNICFH